MRHTLLSLPAALFLLSNPATATATPLQEWRTQVQVSVGGNGVPLQFAFDGGLNEASASQTLGNLTGTALSEAEASLSPDGYIPTLRVRATNSGTRAQAVAWGVQGYTNEGAAPLDTSLLMNLTATLSGGNDIEARIYLFEDENFEFFTDPGTMLFESSSQLWPGFEDFANNLGPTGFDIDINNFSGAVDETRQFDFTVAPGDSFYVWAFLVGTADQSGQVNAWDTLTASFSNTTGLTPAAVAVPEPAAAWLLASAMGLLAWAVLRARPASGQAARRT